MRSDCAARPAYAARWLVIVETQRDRTRHARSGWPLRRRARTGAPAATRIERAVSGVALYRRASFLVDRLGERIFAPHIQIHEAPHQPRAMGAAPFDQE